MIDFRSTRETRASSFDYIQVRIASPDEMRGPKDPKERERLTKEDVMEAAREQQIESLDKVRWGVLETSGNISFIEKQ